jgi:uncharacterized phage-like protein YoqJ
MVTGHRPPELGGYLVPNPTEQWVRATLRSVLQAHRDRDPDVEGLSGMALGADTIFVEVALELGIPLHAAVPFEGQESQWPEASQARYRQLLEHCATVTVVCRPGYEAWKMLERNRYMVGRATHAVAVWKGYFTGGTGHCVRTLRSAKVPTVVLDPGSRTVRKLTP